MYLNTQPDIQQVKDKHWAFLSDLLCCLLCPPRERKRRGCRRSGPFGRWSRGGGCEKELPASAQWIRGWNRLGTEEASPWALGGSGRGWDTPCSGQGCG